MKRTDSARRLPVSVLLVEDNDDDVTLIREAIGEEDLVSITGVVRDGEEALAYLRRQGRYRKVSRPALVLLDINMPKKNGFQVLSELKSDAELRQIPIVMLTTSDRREDALFSYAVGASSFITKPVGFEALQRVMKRFAIYWSRVARPPSPGPG